MILAPAAAQLGSKRLLVVAQGALQLIPFAALPEPGAEGLGDGAMGGLGDGNMEREGARRHFAPSLGRPVAPTPLLVKHEIINLPSASTLAALRRETAKRPPAPKTLALLADPIFERSDERLKLTGVQTQRAAQPGPDQSAQTASKRPRHLARAIEAVGESNDEF